MMLSVSANNEKRMFNKRKNNVENGKAVNGCN